MPKKPPSVSLRKPPAAVDLDRAEAFVRKPGAPDDGETSEQAQTPERLNAQTSKGSDVRTFQRPNAQAPGQPRLPTVPEEPKARPLPRGVVARSDGRTLRRMTLYLPDELARRLAVHCARESHELSAFVSEAVRRRLDALEG